MDAPDDRPWEQPGNFRLDCEPHRGFTLRFLAWIAFVGSVLLFFASFFSGFIIIIFVPLIALYFVILLSLAITLMILARWDLRKMNAGVLDPTGKVITAEARDLAIGSFLVLVAHIICAIVVVVGVLLR
jgi:hypothetical protein